ncbi:MAG: hypothetical protein BWY09_02049 [Candidatus Hydrogenedentes bacterium ADurb.Bin179]|nr:MAG: hypothetical protein BWY09_02049 [Candidatus Hydrogenedentes bacterium ADurb.Bin179]
MHQFAQDGHDAARAAHILDMPLVGGRHLADVRHTRTDLVKPLQGIDHARFPGDGQRVQHGIGRAAHGHVQGEGIVDGFGCHNVPGTQTRRMNVQQLFRGRAHQVPAFR